MARDGDIGCAGAIIVKALTLPPISQPLKLLMISLSQLFLLLHDLPVNIHLLVLQLLLLDDVLVRALGARSRL